MTAPANIDLLPSQATVLAGVKPDGKVAPIALDANSLVLTTDSGQGGGASAANQVLALTALADILSKLTDILTQLTPPTTRTNPTPITLTNAGTAYPLASAAAKSAIVRNTTNSGYIYVGGPTFSASTSAIKLGPDESYSTICTNANQISLVGSTGGMTAAYEVLS